MEESSYKDMETREKREGYWRVISNIPGRLRIRMYPQKNQTEQMKLIEKHLKDQTGIKQIHPNPQTGSVLIHYDQKTRHHREILHMLRDIGIILYDVTGEGGGGSLSEHSSTANQITGAISDLDNHIFHLTGGTANLKLVVPLIMGVFGVRQILKNGWGIKEIPGFVLVWYAVDAFCKFHCSREKSGQTAGDEV